MKKHLLIIILFLTITIGVTLIFIYELSLEKVIAFSGITAVGIISALYKKIRNQKNYDIQFTVGLPDNDYTRKIHWNSIAFIGYTPLQGVNEYLLGIPLLFANTGSQTLSNIELTCYYNLNFTSNKVRTTYQKNRAPFFTASVSSLQTNACLRLKINSLHPLTTERIDCILSVNSNSITNKNADDDYIITLKNTILNRCNFSTKVVNINIRLMADQIKEPVEYDIPIFFFKSASYKETKNKFKTIVNALNIEGYSHLLKGQAFVYFSPTKKGTDNIGFYERNSGNTSLKPQFCQVPIKMYL